MAWRHFRLEEFACNCCGANEISTAFVNELDGLREALGFPLIITSGYRCPTHNERVSTTGRNGPHTTGKAADIKVHGKQAHELVQFAMQYGFTGIGVKQRGDWSRRFIHLDILESPDRFRPTIWSY